MIKKIPYKRRRASLTNYERRLKLVKSHKPRLVIRLTNKQVICQIIKYEPKGDKTIIGLSSNFLSDYGVKTFNNTPCCYLAGLRLGTLAKKKGVKEAILDIGLHPSIKGGRIYACVKGVSDSGVSVPFDPSVMPKPERITGSHIKGFKFKELKEKVMKE